MTTKWSYYPEQNPSLAQWFSDQDSQTITQKFDSIRQGISRPEKYEWNTYTFFLVAFTHIFCVLYRLTLPSGAVVDLNTFQCTVPGRGDVCRAVVRFSNDFVPYVVVLGGPDQGISSEDRVLMNSLPQTSIGHKWLWWWSQAGRDPFIDEYERQECKKIKINKIKAHKSHKIHHHTYVYITPSFFHTSYLYLFF